MSGSVQRPPKGGTPSGKGVQSRINGFAVTGGTVAERWASFRAQIEPELAAVRPKPPAPDEPGCLLNPHPKGWKPPKVKPYRKRHGHRQNEIERRAKNK